MIKLSPKTWGYDMNAEATIGLWASVVVLAMLSVSYVWAGGTIEGHSSPVPPYTVLRINAYGGAIHGTKLKVVSDCPPSNTDCAWTLLPNGMIISDTDPTLAWNAYGGARHGAEVTLVKNCPPNNTDCTWTIRSDGMIVSNTDPNLAVSAYGGVHHGAPLKLVNNCAPRLDGCRWWGWYDVGWPWGLQSIIGLKADIGGQELLVNAYGGARHMTALKVVDNCPFDFTNSDCLWVIGKDGMITSYGNALLGWNAYGGARVGAEITLVENCPAHNTDCLWDTREDGLIVSRSNPKLAVKALPSHTTPLVLVDDCTPAIAGCRWYIDNGLSYRLSRTKGICEKSY